MACMTGDAWGFTDTRSPGRSCSNHRAVMMEVIDALDAWWPPTLRPERFGRTLLAWWIMDVASHRTRRSMDPRTSSRAPAAPSWPAEPAAADVSITVTFTPLVVATAPAPWAYA